MLLHPSVHRNPTPPSHLSDLSQVRYLHPQIQLQLHARRHLLRHERRAMDQHLAQGNQLDRRRNLLAHRLHLLCPRGLQGPAIPGKQDAWWTGCCPDDHIKGDGAAWWLDTVVEGKRKGMIESVEGNDIRIGM